MREEEEEEEEEEKTSKKMQLLSGKTVLVTGAAGYIGSHTCLQLLREDCTVIAYDNLDNSSFRSLERVKRLSDGKGGKVVRIEGDILDGEKLDAVFEEHDIFAVVHFAGLKAVGESCSKPLRYYENNINGTVVLLEIDGQKQSVNRSFLAARRRCTAN